VGLGGSDCVAPVLLARFRGIKTIIFESNSVPGLAVRCLERLAHCVAVQWSETARYLRSGRTKVLGNPVRSSILAANRRDACRRLGLDPRRLTLLAMGGSQGALRLNEIFLAALRKLKIRHIQVLHLTGTEHLAECVKRAEGLEVTYRPLGFLERMQDAYAAADFAFGRAGGSSLAELTAVGIPAILVPYPYAADDHQRANAQLLAAAEAAVMIPQTDLNDERLAQAIDALVCSRAMRERMASNSKRIGRPRAAFDVAAEIASMAGFGMLIDASRTTRGTDTKRLAKAA
jgi:UDP-N-acetylglucosamine--N-acetylmuramyl-(pentapeptide) pyrophosphoryl-undecaprenol N-acetylglucosamine transferase